MFSTLQRHNRNEKGFKVAKFDAILDQARGTTIESGLKSTECYGNDSKPKIGAGQAKHVVHIYLIMDNCSTGKNGNRFLHRIATVDEK